VLKQNLACQKLKDDGKLEIVVTCLNCGGDRVDKWWDKNAINYELFLLQLKIKNTNIKIIHCKLIIRSVSV
jgi:hypothetical protein